MHTLRRASSAALIFMLASIPGHAVVAQSDTASPPPGPVPVTGTLVCEGQPAEPVDAEPVVTEHTWDASDSRLSGSVTYTGTWQLYDPPAEEACACSALAPEPGGEPATYRIVNEGGAWLCTTTRADGPIEGASTTHTAVFAGEGGYEGLTAYLVIDWGSQPFSFAGLIVPGEVPPYAPPQG